VCTWLSFDGGVTWADVAEGTWIYEYADWGGLVVMSKHELNGPADEVRQRVWRRDEAVRCRVVRLLQCPHHHCSCLCCERAACRVPPAWQVRFSYDYGRCWQSVPLATAMFVENIR
jgi:hypothetical protein